MYLQRIHVEILWGPGESSRDHLCLIWWRTCVIQSYLDHLKAISWNEIIWSLATFPVKAYLFWVIYLLKRSLLEFPTQYDLDLSGLHFWQVPDSNPCLLATQAFTVTAHLPSLKSASPNAKYCWIKITLNASVTLSLRLLSSWLSFAFFHYLITFLMLSSKLKNYVFQTNLMKHFWIT